MGKDERKKKEKGKAQPPQGEPATPATKPTDGGNRRDSAVSVSGEPKTRKQATQPTRNADSTRASDFSAPLAFKAPGDKTSTSTRPVPEVLQLSSEDRNAMIASVDEEGQDLLILAELAGLATVIEDKLAREERADPSGPGLSAKAVARIKTEIAEAEDLPSSAKIYAAYAKERLEFGPAYETLMNDLYADLDAWLVAGNYGIRAKCEQKTEGARVRWQTSLNADLMGLESFKKAGVRYERRLSPKPASFWFYGVRIRQQQQH
ncbi:hypothetical protein DFJ74DRAFT_705485 [Hyaloraphidium curvatum]|nr:hypothetical protein DFJ74DRAFT_705485 [Hyaloraphidium curvatum]